MECDSLDMACLVSTSKSRRIRRSVEILIIVLIHLIYSNTYSSNIDDKALIKASMMFNLLPFLTFALLITCSLGRVTNLIVPDTIQAGENLTAVLEITSYSQNWDDFGVSANPDPIQSSPVQFSPASLVSGSYSACFAFESIYRCLSQIIRQEVEV